LLSALAFVTAIGRNYRDAVPIANTASESYSRAAGNLALLAIALLQAARNHDTRPL
jgi:hypothetical protein